MITYSLFPKRCQMSNSNGPFYIAIKPKTEKKDFKFY